jgi:hypothetical protein
MATFILDVFMLHHVVSICLKPYSLSFDVKYHDDTIHIAMKCTNILLRYSEYQTKQPGNSNKGFEVSFQFQHA